MSSEPWDPMSSLLSLRDAVDRLLESAPFGRRSAAPLNLRDEGDQYVVTVAMPGVRPEDINVRVSGTMLEITGETREMEEHETGRWLIRELETGRIERVEALPGPVDVDRATTQYEHGILTIRLPKLTPSGARRIPVRSGDASDQPLAATTQEAPVGHVQARASSPPPSTSSTQQRPLDRTQVREGMEVVGADGRRVGVVKEVRDRDFLVDRTLKRDVYIPYDAATSVEETRVILAIGAEQVDAMDWEEPRLIT